MRVYVASSWRNPMQEWVVKVLREAGHNVYDFRNPHQTRERENGRKGKGLAWTEIDPNWQEWTDEQFREALKTQPAIDAFHSDFDAINWCDACVMVPGNTAGRSMHLELGYAAGLGKLTVILLQEKGEPELMYKLATHLCLSLNEVVEVIRRNQALKKTWNQIA